MPRLSNRSAIEQLLDKFEPEVRAAFLAAIRKIQDAIVLRVIVERLQKQDVQGAIAAMHLDADAYADLERTVLQAYNAGGQATVDDLPKLTDPAGNRVVFRFGVRNLGGEQELRQNSAAMVTNIVADQRAAIRTALEEGLSQGQNPTRTALNVVGKINRVTGRREGGIIGLTQAQERYVASARAELSSGDPEALRNYLTRGRRDKRFDRAVMQAIKAERPLPADAVDKITARYSDSLLKLRGDMIGRTETIRALGKSRDDAIRQQINAGKIDAADVTKEWVAAIDGRTRETHVALHGKSASMDGKFHSPSGAFLAFPGDPSAPAAEVVNCRCVLTYRIDYIGRLARHRAA